VIPIPATVRPREGTFTLDPRTRIQAPDVLRPLAELARDMLRPASGLRLDIAADADAPRISLALEHGDATHESYRLLVSPGEARIIAPAPEGLFYGLQTFRQLLPAAIYRRAVASDVDWTARCVEIADRPRFGWRGLHLDVSRHFMPKEMVLKQIDLLAMHKLNVFHWHLTDDQGWRIEIERYPKLTEVGAWRRETMVGGPQRDPTKRTFDGKPHGGFYTQDDVREVVRYAADRFITVIPEIEMPGHARAAIAAYPEMGNDPGAVEVGTWWGIYDKGAVFGVEDRSLRFLEDVMEEVLALFPSRFIHVGGDEVRKNEWRASAAAQARMKAEGLKNEDELQSWFIRHFDTWLAQRGRRLVGWDEILEGGLAPGATVMSWRGEDGGIAAAKAGHDVVMAPQKPTYFDHYQSKDPKEPIAIGGHNSLTDVYAYEPVPASLSGDEAARVLGAQAQVWTEFMPDARHVEYMLWPRMCAMAEVLWSPRETRDLTGFMTRLRAHLERLRALDVNFRPLDPA
jgi:hexosaminidase